MQGRGSATRPCRPARPLSITQLRVHRDMPTAGMYWLLHKIPGHSGARAHLQIAAGADRNYSSSLEPDTSSGSSSPSSRGAATADAKARS